MAAGEHFQETEVEVRLRWAANCHLSLYQLYQLLPRRFTPTGASP